MKTKWLGDSNRLITPIDFRAWAIGPLPVVAAVTATTLILFGEAFQKAFGRPVNGTDLVRAIAAYERTLVSFDSPFDHFIAGDQNAIDEAAKRDWELLYTKCPFGLSLIGR
jgi:cytochrome c peroxidase